MCLLRLWEFKACNAHHDVVALDLLVVVLDLLVEALDLPIRFFLHFRRFLYSYVVVLDLPGSVDQEPLHGEVGELVLDVMVLDLSVVVLDLARLLETRVLSTFWWMWWFLIYLRDGSWSTLFFVWPTVWWLLIYHLPCSGSWSTFCFLVDEMWWFLIYLFWCGGSWSTFSDVVVLDLPFLMWWFLIYLWWLFL